MKTQTALLAALTVVVSGCDGRDSKGETPAPAAKAITVANPFHDSLIKLDELRRGAALRRAIRDAQETCDRVETAAFQQDYTNLKMWVATCQRTAYAIFLAPTGDVQVRQCTDLASLKLPVCSLPEAAPTKG